MEQKHWTHYRADEIQHRENVTVALRTLMLIFRIIQRGGRYA